MFFSWIYNCDVLCSDLIPTNLLTFSSVFTFSLMYFCFYLCFHAHVAIFISLSNHKLFMSPDMIMN